MANQPNKFVSVLLAAIAGAIGAGIFFLIGGLIGSVLAAALHISPMEGARGYFSALIGFIAGVLGFIAGAWLVLRRRGLRGVQVAIGGVTAVAILVAAAGSVLGVWYTMQPHRARSAGDSNQKVHLYAS